MNHVIKSTIFTGIFFFISMFLPYYGESSPTQAPQNTSKNLSDQEVNERIQFINSSLKTGETGSRIWYWSFLGLYSAGTITQLSLYFAAPSIEPVDLVKREHFRQDMMMGTITTAIGVLSLAISPMPSMYARNAIESMPDDTMEDRIAKLKKSEKLLAESSKWEKESNSLLMHGLNFGLNLSAGLIIWLAFHRTIIDGLVTFAPGFLIGEIQLFTQPTKAVKDWNNYENKYSQNQASYLPQKNNDNLWHLAVAPGGLMIVRQF
ncbi:MAG: hypothetical protein OEV78_04135 [Spirochaetia bacterium]|nr:hypothetical protein [Spirochaetia bacterium]